MAKPHPTGDQTYTAADLKRAAGLSYRQINEWDQKGVLPETRSGDAGWRKFSPRDIFALMVCSEIRRQFGVPVESLKWVRACMLQEGADHLHAAAQIMSRGMAVVLMTDLKETFVMDSDLEIEDLLRLGYLRHEDPQGYLLIKLNPLVNGLLGCLKEPLILSIDDEMYGLIRNIRGEMSIRSQKELEILGLLRSGAYRKVVVHLDDGKILRADTEAGVSEVEQQQLLRIWDGEQYQTMTLTLHDGKVVTAAKQKPVKFDKPRARRRAHERE
ncbi:MAG: MerR family transcriptional regulator [Cenarchaeum sp. SB0669_bin_11]|nr:MerR family transcriptional regulator [Acidobacteriota bacterium]MYH21857.1 MerR family transcriptional regulator [Acidobacteriota bacterium]MYL11498.1 MerR family transcriptional regulator [Cenarchaeum sp. SB0669_bin_11]